MAFKKAIIVEVSFEYGIELIIKMVDWVESFTIDPFVTGTFKDDVGESQSYDEYKKSMVEKYFLKEIEIDLDGCPKHERKIEGFPLREIVYLPQRDQIRIIP